MIESKNNEAISECTSKLGFENSEFVDDMFDSKRRLFIWQGEGGTGKSTLARKIAETYPNRVIQTNLDVLFNYNYNCLNLDLFYIFKNDIKLVIVDELSYDFDGDMAKKIRILLSGDKRAVRPLDGVSQIFETQFNVLLICNNLPDCYQKIIDKESDSGWICWLKSFIWTPISSRINKFTQFTLVKF